MNTVKAVALIVLGVALVAMGLYIADVDDAPGAVVPAFLLMAAAVYLGVRAGRNRLPVWAWRTALAIGLLVAAFAAYLTHAVSVTAPLFAEPTAVPSVSEPASSPQWMAAVDRARTLVRAAIIEQNLPGISIAVGTGTAGVVWAEGFGWRDVRTETPVTPQTRFNIGSASPVVGAAAIASFGMSNTGTDSAEAWSPEAVGEPGEDFPPLAAMRHLVLQPIGVAPPEYPLPGDRATFYVPATQWKNDSTNPREGRRLMFMRDLACCAGGKAFYSTPSDLVRFALAANADRVNGELAGGTVMSLVMLRDKGIAVAVASNITHANTAALAARVADVFAE